MKGKKIHFFFCSIFYLLLNASIHSCALSLSTGICKETVVIIKTHKMLHYGCACAADAAACLWKRTCWIRVMMQGCGYYKASINAADPVKPHSAKRVRLLQYDIHSRANPPPNTYIRKVHAFLFRALILRKSIPINLQPTLFFPMHQNVDRGK